jgi:hypothetical protein
MDHAVAIPCFGMTAVAVCEIAEPDSGTGKRALLILFRQEISAMRWQRSARNLSDDFFSGLSRNK